MLQSLCLLFLLAVCSSTHPSGSDALIKFRPKIISPTNSTITPYSDKTFQITCKANCSWESIHMIYWLVNGTFVEDFYPDGRVSEDAPKQSTKRSSFILESNLIFKNIISKDYKNKFTCIVQDPSGMDKKDISLIHSLKRPASHQQ